MKRLLALLLIAPSFARADVPPPCWPDCPPVKPGCVAKILQVIPNGPQSIVILNRGETLHLRPGDEVHLVGPDRDVPIRVTEVYAVRSKGVVDVPADELVHEERCVRLTDVLRRQGRLP